MSLLAVRTLIERGVEPSRIWVANRTFQRAFELVAAHGVSAVRWESLDVELAAADVLVTCTGAAGIVFDRDRIERATADGRPLTVIDLALPRDVVARGSRPAGRRRSSTSRCWPRAPRPTRSPRTSSRSARSSQSEVDAFLAGRQQAKVTPTVVALRTHGHRGRRRRARAPRARLPGLDEAQRDEVRRAMRRVAEKLIHQPTVRVKELVEGPAT